jgi:hypothetical protein
MTREDLKAFVAEELKGLERGIVATPESVQQLEAFAKANNGSMDIVLMHMAIQYGMKIAFKGMQSVL